MWLSDIAYKHVEISSAIYYCRRPLSQQPYNVDALKKLSLYLFLKEFWLEYRVVVQKAIEAARFLLRAYLPTAECRIKQGNVGAAISILQLGVKIFPESIQLREHLCAARLLDKQWNESVDTALKALNISANQKLAFAMLCAASKFI